MAKGLSVSAQKAFDPCLEALEEQIKRGVVGEHIDGNGVSADPVDHAVSDLLAEVQFALAENRADLLRRVQDARGRIRDRVFGLCVTCDQPVGNARLNAMPYAENCINCQRAAEQNPSSQHAVPVIDDSEES